MTNETQNDALAKARDGLVQLQQPDGRFEGVLTSNAYPTLACMLIDLQEGKPLDDRSKRWLQRNQLSGGRYPLDPENNPSDEAARLAKAVLQASLRIEEDAELRETLQNIPDLGWRLWIVKTFGAMRGLYDWERLIPPRRYAAAGRVLGAVAPLLPNALRRRLKPPMHIAPPVSLFRQKAFQRLFPAEQYTLAPLLLIIEARTRRRPDRMKELASWVLSRQAADGSWFCVAFITAVAAMALVEAQRAQVDERIAKPLERALQWLERMRNADGGRREAASLNVWDTALAVKALAQAGVAPQSETLQNARRWLHSVQNIDGGWAFHGFQGRGLPSDADDTALAAYALMENGAPLRQQTLAVQRAVQWLRGKQARGGSWATYSPGEGDVGCVSVTAHAAETMMRAGETDAAQKAVRWLLDAQNRDGSWDDLWIAKRSYGTAKALIAMAKTGFGDERRIQKGVQRLQEMRNADGGWGETQAGEPAPSTAEQTANAAQALIALQFAPQTAAQAADPTVREAARRALRWLIERQRPDGGWDPSPVGIYWEVIGGYANPMNAWVFPLLAISEKRGG